MKRTSFEVLQPIPIQLSTNKSYIIVVLIFLGLFIAFLVGLYVQLPSMYYLCTIVIIIDIIALLFYSSILSSLCLSYLPIFIVLMVDMFKYQSYAVILHVINFILCTIVIIRDWKNMNALIVFMNGFLNIAIIVSFSLFVKEDIANNSRFYEWNGNILNIYIIIVYLLINSGVSIVIFYLNQQNIKEPMIQLQYSSLDVSEHIDPLKIHTMDFTDSKLTLFPSIDLYKNLHHLNLSYNNITSIPESVCNIPNINIDVSHNPIKTLPSCMKCNYFKTNCTIKGDKND
ncbi:MAG: hypothetical protein WC934_02790 [Acidithiobacillus sp.]|jgi:hypothetical protein|uniref:hypothetical protein n=1 Tax=Acidithiobacillus sp. TaxID=1872118 RepID=UPI003560EB92